MFKKVRIRPGCREVTGPYQVPLMVLYLANDAGTRVPHSG